MLAALVLFGGLLLLIGAVAARRDGALGTALVPFRPLAVLGDALRLLAQLVLAPALAAGILLWADGPVAVRAEPAAPTRRHVREGERATNAALAAAVPVDLLPEAAVDGVPPMQSTPTEAAPVSSGGT